MNLRALPALAALGVLWPVAAHAQAPYRPAGCEATQRAHTLAPDERTLTVTLTAPPGCVGTVRAHVYPRPDGTTVELRGHPAAEYEADFPGTAGAGIGALAAVDDQVRTIVLALQEPCWEVDYFWKLPGGDVDINNPMTLSQRGPGGSTTSEGLPYCATPGQPGPATPALAPPADPGDPGWDGDELAYTGSDSTANTILSGLALALAGLFLVTVAANPRNETA